VYEGVRLLEPLAPTTAARRQGLPLPDLDVHAKTIHELAATHDWVLVEGAGGLLVGLDDEGHNLADLAARLTVPFTFVVVVRAGLGTLNHSGLTVEALRTRGLPIAGLVIGSWPAEPDLAERCNLEDLPAVTGVPLIGRVPAGAGALDRNVFMDVGKTWITLCR
jgi:dethiobiotin synthetase